MTINDIMRLKPGQIAAMDRGELAKITSQLASAANKRLRRLESANLANTPAYSYTRRSGGDFSVKGKDVAALQLEFQRARGFLSPERRTSTVRGARKVQKEVQTATESFMTDIGSDYGEWSDDDKKAFWKFFDGKSVNQTLESYFGGYRGRESIKLAQEVFARSKTRTKANLRRAFRNAAKRAYETAQEEAYDDDSDFFDL